MAITPPRDFFWQPLQVNINGVLSANPPLSITGTTMSISDASLVQSGVVNTAIQQFAGAKNLNDGLSVAGGTLVTDVSTDSTFAVATDNQVSTKKAIKDYLASGAGGIITSVSLPLTVTAFNLDINDASAISDGIVTTGPQTIAGAKTFTGDLTCTSATVGTGSVGPNAIQATGTIGTTSGIWNGGSIYMDAAASNQVLSTNAAGHLIVGCGVNGPFTRYQALGSGGNLYSFVGDTPGAHFIVSDPDTATNLLDINSAGNTITVPSTITYVGSNQLTLVNGTGSVTFDLSAGGDLTLNASGNDLNFHSTDRVHVLNTTAATSPTTGAFQCAGGAGIAGGVWCGGLRAVSTVSPQLYIEHSVGNTLSSTVDGSGNLSMVSTGTRQTFTQNTIESVYMDSTFTRMNVGTEMNATVKYLTTPTLYSPSGGGPFNNFAIADADYICRITLAAVTSGSHLTGVQSPTTYKGRMIELMFESTGGSKDFIIDHESASSTAANRIWIPKGATSSTMTLVADPIATLRLYYHGTHNRWVVCCCAGEF